MRRFLALFMVAVLFVAAVMVGVSANTQKANAAPEVNCTLQVLNIICVEAGVTVLNQPVDLPTVRVTVPGPAGPTVTQPAPPRATVTRTVEVEVPGPRSTVTAPAAPVATRTITAPGSVTTRTLAPVAPAPAPTRTVTAPTRTATVSVTETVSPSPRQEPTTPATIDPSDSIVTIPNIPFVPLPPKVEAGIGIVLLGALLIILGLFSGYYLGYKDAEKNEARFLKSLLNR